MVVLAASICTRGGKAVLSRQFREMPRSRIEALLASFPKQADSGTQHTTVEQDNVRFVYQPLDELYMVLITNRQSNILQDIDSLHLFAQVVTSTCKSLDEREIVKNAYELLSAFDELVTLGYRENLTISQIKTFLDMESHEERIQEIIARNKELEATEERKRKAKQLEMQRKESARSGRGIPRTPVYPTYTPPSRPSANDSYDSYEAEKNKTFNKPVAPKAKGMMLGKKSKTTDMFERVRGEMGGEVDDTPLVTPTPAAAPAEPRVSSTLDRDAIHISVSESITAKLSREGAINSMVVSGDLTLRVSDPSLTKIKLGLHAVPTHGAQFRTHPNVDRNLFNSSKTIQMSNAARGFPVNNAVGVLRWRATPKVDDSSACPITFTVWVNKDADKYNMTVEYELTGSDELRDVSVVIPYQGSEPNVSSFDAAYDVSGDTVEWYIGTVDSEHPNGSFEFEAESSDENDFFPMNVRFNKSSPFVDVDVLNVSLIEENEEVTFSKEIKSAADNFVIDMELAVFSETEFQQRAPAGFPISCPTLDLAATWDGSGNNLLVYRPPGQLVSKIHQFGAPGSKAPEALAVKWRPDGQFLAVGWSDGVVRLMGLENNKAAHHIQVCDAKETKITHIGWATNKIDKTTRAAPSRSKGRLSTEPGIRSGSTLADLPRELMFLEVDTALPRISPLPTGTAGTGDDALVFTLRSGIDFLFQALKPEDYDQVNVMVVGTSNGQLQLSIYDSFIIGTFTLPSLGTATPSRLIYHASHPQLSTHMLLLTDTPSEPEVVDLIPMDLPFVASSPINLSLLASKLTTLQKLLRYLKQTQLHMQAEWKNARELPARFIRGVQEDLENMESGPRGIVAALYHTAVTGHAHEPLREWLVDSLAERGHKRWDKAVVSGLENLRSLVHENFLPVLERCAIILSRLKGLAQFHDARNDIGLSVAQIHKVLDIVSCLTLVGHKVLVLVMDELEHFAVFSVWLRFQIDQLAGPSAGEELTEKEATMDYSKVLTYIQRYLTASPLDVYFDQIPKDAYTTDVAHVEDTPSLLDLLDKQLKKQAEGQQHMRALPHVDFLVDYLTSRSNTILHNIADAKRRSVRLGKPIRLTTGHKITHVDLRMCEAKANTGMAITAMASRDAPSTLHVFRSGFELVGGISSNLPVMSCRVDTPNKKIIDLKFLNDQKLLVLCQATDGAPAIISVPVQSTELPYSDYDSENASSIPPVSADEFPSYSFLSDKMKRPVGMEVHDKSDVRGEIPARVCLLDANRIILRTFSLPKEDNK
ncbi:Coatomer subunit delta [Paramyrothecium foliicola]|nr:Coatomer subunit delta [Paramyrothecium foliicola]